MSCPGWAFLDVAKVRAVSSAQFGYPKRCCKVLSEWVWVREDHTCYCGSQVEVKGVREVGVKNWRNRLRHIQSWPHNQSVFSLFPEG